MKYFTFISIFSLSCLSTYGQPLLMSLGEELKLPSPPNEHITLSQPGIVHIQEKEQSIILKAKKVGSLVIQQGTMTHVIQVLSENDKKGWLEFLNTIQKDPWLYLSDLPFKVQGHMYRLTVWKKLQKLSHIYNIPYTLQAHIPLKIRKQIQNFLQEKLKSPSFHIQWDSNPITVQIPPSFPLKIFQTLGLSIQKDSQLSPLPSLVEIQLLLTQVSQNWSSNIHVNSNLDWTNFSLDQIIQLLFSKNRGESRILAHTKVLIESEQSMNMLLGGETPTHQFNVETSSKSIQWKPYGVTLQITPKVQPLDRIKITLSADFSEIDHTHSSEGSPATKNFRLNTTFHSENNKTLLLSTIQRRHEGSFFQNPLSFWNLNSFLSQNKGTSKEKSKAFIFLIPKIIKRDSL